MIRPLPDGFELDDDPARVDLDAVHAFLSREAYWAQGRSRETVERLVRGAQRVVGLYREGRQVGFCRAATDGIAFVYLADLYVLPEHRGCGLGIELVREMVDNGPLPPTSSGSSTRPTPTSCTRASGSAGRAGE